MSELSHSLQTLEIHAVNDFRRRALVHILMPFIQGNKVLDVGCGMGFMSEAIAQTGREIISTDIDIPYVQYTLQRTQKYTYQNGGVLFGDYQLPFLNSTFDTIVSLDVIEHVEDDIRLVDELVRILKDDGRLIVTVPALQTLYGKRDIDLGHYRRYNKAVLHHILERSNVVLQRLEYWNLLGVLPYFISERVFKRQLPDSIRKGTSSPYRHIIATILTIYLVAEHKLPIPLGLSLIAIVKKKTNDKYHKYNENDIFSTPTYNKTPT